MSGLEEGLSDLLRALDEDHHRLACALDGRWSLAPEDPDLDILFTLALTAPSDVTLLDFYDVCPDAVQRHLEWVARRCVVDLRDHQTREPAHALGRAS